MCLCDVCSLIPTKPHTKSNVGRGPLKKTSHIRPIYLYIQSVFSSSLLIESRKDPESHKRRGSLRTLMAKIPTSDMKIISGDKLKNRALIMLGVNITFYTLLRYMGVVWFVFHGLQLLPSRFTQ
jgi:hypothetical protein